MYNYAYCLHTVLNKRNLYSMKTTIWIRIKTHKIYIFKYHVNNLYAKVLHVYTLYYIILFMIITLNNNIKK